ncbi:MAG TPA: GMC family oxidoreductase N-terminal domain-containing protein [Burkholderiales bacterium]|nr:GMC family oxidoreductase N-terminal domain-containing protein [Burkholderiales bacterium]
MSGNGDTFDYVIVGAGAAGALLANRLTEDGTTTACLLEAGPADWHPFFHLPAGYIKVVFDPAFTFPFTTEPGEHTGGRRIPIPQGRVLGGSTSINGLVFNRGQREDYDNWAALGNRGWVFDDVLPYFKRLENRIGVGDDGLRGGKGELPVTDIDWKHPITEAFIAGAQGLGIPRNPDYNGASQEGVGYFQRTIHRGRRMSTAATFLRAAKARRNLDVRTRAQATALVFNGTRATGVRYARNRNSPISEVRARREVIVSCGAINTPKLLQLSGIGSAGLLQKLGIPVRADLAGVGANLRDHFSIRLVARVKNISTINELSRGASLAGQVARWLLGKPSILALSPSLVHFFCRSGSDAKTPDLQGVFTPASYKEGYVGMLDDYPGMSCGVWQHRPRSTGTVQARSLDAFEAPAVRANYLENPYDREILLRGMRLARRLLHAPELARFQGGESLPGPRVQSDDELLDYVHRYAVSSYHLNGTAKMGPPADPMAVVDDQLRVRGMQGLRVVDSSVMPDIPSANIAAATMMIAEKASDMIRGRPCAGEP